MKMIYISHPYSGQEVKNRSQAVKIAAGLFKKTPYVLFINPLDVMRHLKTAKASYEVVMEKCKALLEKCDGIIMTGEWKASNGCMEEYNYAKSLRIPIWESFDEFRGDEVMDNDCFGSHASCESCICRTCANRLECWNCNDCIKENGQGSPVGYTGKDIWEPECKRYIKRG